MSFYIDPVTIDPDDNWTRVDIPSLWQAELFPLLDNSSVLQKNLEKAVNRWAEDNSKHRLKKRWRYSDREAITPFELGGVDFVCAYIDQKIEQAAEAGHLLALEHRHMFDGLGDGDEPTPAQIHREYEIGNAFLPKRSETPEALRPIGSCHYFAEFQLALAQAWRPGLNWRVLRGDEHSTVIEPERRLVFDWLLLEATANDVLWFALEDERSESYREVLEVRRFNEQRSASL